MNIWLDAAFWIGLALTASILSVWSGISVAMIEIIIGVIAGNYLGLITTQWVDFLAGFGSIFLTFLAGAEVDPAVLRSKFKESVSMGVVSFLIPFLVCFAYAYYKAGWTLEASEIAGIALSTTSVAIVYSVMVETGLNTTELGKIILAACFITDLGTVLALGVIFAQYNVWLYVFIAVMVLALFLVNKIAGPFTSALGGRVSQVEVKLIYFFLFLLGGLALKANSEAVLPAYLLGLALAKLLAREKEMLARMRTTAFATLTPFFFLKAGLLLSVKALWAGLAVILILLGVKMMAKFIGVMPLSLLFKFGKNNSIYTTLLMSTGLTFGSISAMFGLTHNIINQQQYSVLVTAVVLSGIVPTLIAQTYFRPDRSKKVKPVALPERSN
ncbi:cation:proton antiporter [Pelotomaculum propionicicum]|uniref:Na(+)/H(+) antiporter n=1 Tax=Pelotomaculum propionicicum TaxID=258475 RepID=A0A4Y7RMR3_9FIRM|nr:cation:proton antiporter [Pelotomaculum propionicicum]TEB09962.1 Na(+)/H(+) antiporter [Pelotomaculum propionicicum]